MNFGLTDKQYSFIEKCVVSPIEGSGARVFCYGSRARGDHKPFSDLDLMIETNDGVKFNVGQIREDLQKSNFPFKVDLVEFDKFAESYREGYENDKVRFSS